MDTIPTELTPHQFARELRMALEAEQFPEDVLSATLLRIRTGALRTKDLVLLCFPDPSRIPEAIRHALRTLFRFEPHLAAAVYVEARAKGYLEDVLGHELIHPTMGSERWDVLLYVGYGSRVYELASRAPTKKVAHQRVRGGFVRALLGDTRMRHRVKESPGMVPPSTFRRADRALRAFCKINKILDPETKLKRDKSVPVPVYEALVRVEVWGDLFEGRGFETRGEAAEHWAALQCLDALRTYIPDDR